MTARMGSARCELVGLTPATLYEIFIRLFRGFIAGFKIILRIFE